MRTKTLTLLIATLLVLSMTALGVPAVLGAAGPSLAAGNGPGQGQGNGPPAGEPVHIQLNLTGVATRTDGGPDDGFTAFVNVSGEGTRRTNRGNGNGVQVRATGLTAHVLIMRNSDDARVENFTALVGFHAQQASSAAHGEPDGFRFSLQIRGKRSQAVVGNEDPDERVLAMNAHGTTTGAPDDNGTFMMDAKGQATTQPDGQGSGARHFNLRLAGTGSIRSADDGGESRGLAATATAAAMGQAIEAATTAQTTARQVLT